MSSFRPRPRAAQTYDLLPPERAKPSPVHDLIRRSLDIEDADFTVISNGRKDRRAPTPGFSPVPPGNDNAHNRTKASPQRSVFEKTKAAGSLSAALGQERWIDRLSENMFSALVAVVFLIVFVLAGGLSALAMVDGGEVAAPRVDVSHVTALPRTVNGLPMLVVSGIVENNGETLVSSPRLRAEIYSGGRLVASTVFRTRTGDIGSGESRGFQAKLPQAGGKAPEVKVYLAE